MSSLCEKEENPTKDIPEDVRSVQLTSDAIPKLLDGASIPKLVLQVLTFRAIEEVNDDILHRISLSDGKNYTTFAITSQTLVDKHQIEEFSVIEISKFQRIPVTNDEETKYLLILQNFEKVHQVCGIVGEPNDFDRIVDKEALDSTTVVTYKDTQQEEPMVIPEDEQPEEVKEPEKQLLPGRLVTLESLPIESKNRYWVIKFRVLNKLPVRSLFGGSSRMLTFDLGDSTGMMKACAFDKEVERFNNGLEIGKTYWLTDALVRLTKDSHINSNKYEIKVTRYTKFVECKDDCSVPDIEFNFVPLNKVMNNVSPGEVVDVIGVCTRASHLYDFDSGPDKAKHRCIFLISPDSPQTELNVDIWGKLAEDFNASTNPVIAIKNCKRSTVDVKAQMFLDKTSVFLINPPKLSETKQLTAWYNEFCKDNPKAVNFNSQVCNEVTVESKYFTMGVTRVDTLNKHPTVFLKTFATVLETDPQYTATLICRECNRLVHDLNLKKLVCSSCGFVDGAVVRKLSTRLRIGDTKCNIWVSVNDEHMRQLLGVTGDSYIQSHDTTLWQAMCALKGQFFCVKLKFVRTPESEESKMQCSIVEIDPFLDQTLNTESQLTSN